MPKADFMNGAYNALCKVGVAASLANRVASYMTAQAAHESANFSSNIYMQDNNCVGMKMPSIRPHSNIVGSDNNGYAKYPNDGACAADLVDWLQYNKAPYASFTSLRAYTDWLGSKHYYSDSKDAYYAGANRFLGEVGQPTFTVTGEVPQGMKNMFVYAGIAVVAFFVLR